MYIDIVVMHHAIATAMARYNRNQEVTMECFIKQITDTYKRKTDGKRD